VAASYATGTAISPTDLLQKLVAWLVAQGWTQNMSQADGGGWRAHLSKNGQYVNLRAIVNSATAWTYQSGTVGYGIGFYLGDGFSSGSAWNAQSGAPLSSGTSNVVGAGMFLPSGAISAYHFFDNGSDHVTVVVERTFGNCAHMGWGPSLVKTGYTSDCWYFYGSSSSYYNVYCPTSPVPGYDQSAAAPMAPNLSYGGGMFANAFVRVDATEFSYRWVGLTINSGTSTGYTGRSALNSLNASGSTTYMTEFPAIGLMASRAWQTAFPGALLLPLHCFLRSLNARWIPLGYPPTVFYCGAVGHGFESGDIYTVGGVNYMLFPGFVVLKAA
jgi:hypothetical protein